MHTSLNSKLSAQHKITVGVILDNIHGYFQDSILTNTGDWFKFSDVDNNTWLAQAYGLFQWKFTRQAKLVTGLHYTKLLLNNSQTLEPRFGISITTNKNTTIGIGYGLHSQMQPIHVYGFRFRMAPQETNKKLNFTRSHHFSAEFNKNLSQNLLLKIVGYYQHIFDAPVETISSSFSLLNYGTSYGNAIEPYLENKGQGKNYGVELTVEKYFSNSYYFLITTSLFQSRYQGSDKIWRNTAFNNNYIVNLLGGKEIAVGKNGVIKMDVKLTSSGGRYTTPIDLEASILAEHVVYMDELAYSKRFDNYFRTDLKIGHRMDMKRISQEWLVDIQNVFNSQNVYDEYYNPQTQNIDTQYQLGLLVIPQYRILF